MTSKITKYETEFLTMMGALNEQMTDLAESGLMSEEALRKMGATQVEQWGKVKGLLSEMFKSEYYTKRTSRENSLQTKRMSEKQKRANAVMSPGTFHICQRCDRIFVSKGNLQRHQAGTVLCSVIRLTKKGAVQTGTHRTKKITDYIHHHFDDVESEDEEEVV